MTVIQHWTEDKARCAMSVHVEWMGARETCAEVISPGEDWVAVEYQHPDKTSSP